jgi:hypothetical protein
VSLLRPHIHLLTKDEIWGKTMENLDPFTAEFQSLQMENIKTPPEEGALVEISRDSKTFKPDLLNLVKNIYWKASQFNS